jgi:hypothetical protein
LPVAVVVDRVPADFGGRRLPANEAGVTQPLVHLAVAVVVDVVAVREVDLLPRSDFRVAGRHEPVRIAYPHTGPTRADTGRPAGARVASHAFARGAGDTIRFVRLAIAVVVNVIVAALEHPRVDKRIRVVAVGAAWAILGETWTTVAVAVDARSRANDVGGSIRFDGAAVAAGATGAAAAGCSTAIVSAPTTCDQESEQSGNGNEVLAHGCPPWSNVPS